MGVAGQALPLVGVAAVQALYFANFSRSDLAFQVRLACFLWALLGWLVPPLRFLLGVSLLVVVGAELAVGYNLLERVLYIVPGNRPENQEEVTLDFLTRVLMEPPNEKRQAFSVKPGGA